MSQLPSVAQHYAREGALTGRILSTLTAEGKDLDRLTAEDLSPYDQFHSRGHQATAELAQLLNPQTGQLVLDLGCGIGGPARWLATHRGCRVVGLDLTEVYCRTAGELSARVGLSRQTAFVCADGLALPLAEAGFDLVWTQHAAMNIADKARLYREVARVLKPGGRFGLYDVMAGPAGAPYFPVPWASSAEWSHLTAPEGVRETVLASGLKQRHWRDLTAEAKVWSEKAVAAQTAGPKPGRGPSGPAIILGPSFAEMVANLRRSLFEDRIAVVQAVFEKAG
ncbi:methyltransferase domain-containing protein [Pelagibius sp. CAU 1746]|uniref:class I SAM-dependent methyltransferase n=1 Tax=Pelagibius sp. CAU 1746 TaxID=3140370 RepID=UPI00325AE48B